MGRDPSHPWVGESVPLDYANVISGAPFDDFGDAIRYRVRDDGASTMVAGDSFIAGFYDSQVMLSGDDVVASFVVVCSGSGTIRLSGGVDPDWSLDEPGDATVPMGTHTVSGDTVVVGSAFPSFDVDTYLSQSQETIVYVECLSGTVTVNQVKLRLWPTGGVAGAWVDAPGFTVAGAPQARDVGTSRLGGVGGTYTAGSAVAAFDLAAADLIADANDPALMQAAAGGAASSIQSVVESLVNVAEDTGSPGTFNAGSGTGISATLVRQPDPINVTRINTPQDVGTYGLDYSWPPDEVPGDLGVQLIDTPTVTWGDMTYTVAVTSVLLNGPGPAASLNVTAVPDEAFDNPTLVTIPDDDGDPIPAHAGTDALPLPDARTVLVSLTHPFFNTAPTYEGGAGGTWFVGATTTIDAPLANSTVTIPPYRYWSPTAVETTLHPLRLMQRGDGLGMGSGRALSTGTRQASTRLFGSL